MRANPPLSLYVHLPWCVSKCPYCDFNSHALQGDLPAEEYTQALIADLEADLPLAWGRVVQSVYFGGGTPSLFAADTIDKLLSALRARVAVRPGAEITLEANPGTIEHDSFAAYRQAGINRVSLGVQSFDDDMLQRLGRIHRAAGVAGSLQALAESGISNFNIDLMYALPGQSREQAERDVRMAIAAGPTHISFYQLTLEPNTAFAADPPELPGIDAAWDMQQAGADALRPAGFSRYEISAYARPGRECVHNLNYWTYGDFLAIGAGGHGKVTLPAEGRVQRYAKHRHPHQYLNGLATAAWVAERRTLSEQDLVFEYFLNRLRLRKGFREEEFCARTGVSWSVVEARVSEAIDKGLLERLDGRVQTTALGWNFVNDIQQMFLP
ncbi:MAG: radical SAM family heme chaperone HemW [Lysobacterales bacterium]|jgi:oxygen-independent coproporphyrinogen-3 oxidase